MFSRSKHTALAALPVALFVGCGSGDDGFTPATGSDQSGSSSELTSTVASLPILGAFLAECMETGQAVLMDFVQATPIEPGGDLLVTLQDALAEQGPSTLPVIGGLVPSGDPAELAPVGEQEILMLLPAEGLDMDLPVLGTVPLSCDPDAFPLPGGDLPELPSDPTDALAVIPVIGETGDPVGVLLAVTENLPGDGIPDPTSLELPAGTETLPEPLGSAAADLLSLLGLLGL